MQHEEQKKREAEAAATKWKEISEQHHREKEAEQRRKQSIQDKGKAKIQEEEMFQEALELEIPQVTPTQQDLDTSRLNNLLLPSTLMQTMKARAQEQHQEDNAFKALEVVATTSFENYKDDKAYE